MGYQAVTRVRVAKTTTVYEYYDVPTNEYLDAHEQALEKSKGSETNVKLVGTTHIHETKVRKFLYNRLSTEGDRLQKELEWDS